MGGELVVGRFVQVDSSPDTTNPCCRLLANDSLYPLTSYFDYE